MPTLRVIRLPEVPTVNNNGSVLKGLSSAIAPLNALGADNFQCNVCLENCTNAPHVIPKCLHSFCGDCVSECIRMFGNECPACMVNAASKRRSHQDKKIENVSTTTRI